MKRITRNVIGENGCDVYTAYFHCRDLMSTGLYIHHISVGLSSLRTKGQMLKLCLSNIKGIADFTISGYEVRIERAKAFSWRELIPHIKQSFINVFD